MSYTITESKDVEAKLLANLQKKYSSQRDGIHVSDLTLCIRQSVFRRLKPVTPNSTKLGYFIDGQRKHETLQALYGDGVKEYSGTFQGVSFHVDLLDKIPIELKTTRSNLAAKRISKHWIRQLLYYMLATSSLEGILQIYLINSKNKNEPNFPAYKIQIISWVEVWNDFRNRTDNFQDSLDLKQPYLSYSVWKDPDEGWACKQCDYVKECMKIEKKGLPIQH